MRRLLVSSLPALFLLSAMATGAQSVVASKNETAPKQSLRFRLMADPVTLDWNLAHSSHETYIIMNIMEGLLEEGPDLEPRPALAEKWTVSGDGKTYLFTLRSGVRWSDSTPLKAQQFVDSWLRVLDPKTNSPYASFLFDIEGAELFHQGKLKDRSLVGIKALSDGGLQISLRRPVPYFLHLTSFWVTFPIRGEQLKLKPESRATLGPYRLKEWKRGQLIRLVRNPFYEGSAMEGRADEIEAVIEPNDAKARTLFEAGKLDFFLDATTVDFLKFGPAGQASKVRVQQYPYLATYYLGFNVNLGPLRDSGVRRALALSMDLKEIPAVLQGGQLPAKGWIPPGIQGHDSGAQPSGTLYDARGALARAGYPEGVGFPKLALWVEKFDGAEAIADYVQGSFKQKLGIAIETHVASPSEYQKTLSKGEAGMFIGHWGADYPDASNFLGVFESTSGVNLTGWKSPEYDKLLNSASETSDHAKRKSAFAAAEKILIQNDSVIVPLFYKRNTVLLGPRVQSLEITPLNYLFLKNVGVRMETK